MGEPRHFNRPPRGRAWPASDDATAWRLYWAGSSYDDIAAELKRTRSQVYFRLRAMKRVGGPDRTATAQREARTRRKCLSCRREFASEWAGNRICSSCKHNLEVFQSASMA